MVVYWRGSIELFIIILFLESYFVSWIGFGVYLKLWFFYYVLYFVLRFLIIVLFVLFFNVIFSYVYSVFGGYYRDDKDN